MGVLLLLFRWGGFSAEDLAALSSDRAAARSDGGAMAPFPDEVDVFTGPHWRMKQLVGLYSEKVRIVYIIDYILTLCRGFEVFPVVLDQS